MTNETEAPERIWAWSKQDWFNAGASTHKVQCAGGKDVEYIRADLARHLPDVYVLAEIIRRVDGNNDLGAAALAELILKELE
jgi:hypothetical protein